MLLPVGAEHATTIAERIRAAHAETSPVTASVGVAWMGGDITDGAELRLAAHTALTHAKRSGRDRVRSFDEIADSSLLPTPRRRAALRRIIEDGSIDVAWQPIVRPDGSVQGYEALSRPRSADPDLRHPAAAFQLADLLGATVELDTACREAILARASEVGDAWLFINVSPYSLAGGALDPDAFVSAVVAAGLTPSQVVVELTEREIVDPAALVKPVQDLRASGVKVAIDDLGAGNAGLGVLQSIALDVVKIDRALMVDAAMSRPRASAVVVALDALARDLEVEVVAEGVETPEEISLGMRVGTLLQGYGIARPAPSPTEASAAVRPPVPG